jgi:hypothetical protein
MGNEEILYSFSKLQVSKLQGDVEYYSSVTEI